MTCLSMSTCGMILVSTPLSNLGNILLLCNCAAAGVWRNSAGQCFSDVRISGAVGPAAMRSCIAPDFVATNRQATETKQGMVECRAADDPQPEQRAPCAQGGSEEMQAR